MKYGGFVLFICLVILAFSCAEDKDSTPPIVTINSPTDGSRFEVLEQIPIVAQANDNEQVIAMRSYLVFNDGQSIALNGPSIGTVAPSVNFNANLTLTDTLLPTGNYFIRVDAEDDNNIASAFRSIQITGIPRRKLSLLAVGHDWLNANLWEDNNDLSFQLKKSFNRQHQKTLFVSERQQLWTADLSGKKLSATQWKENRPLIEVDFQQNVSQPFEALETNGEGIYYSTKEELVAYSNTPTKRFSIFPSPNRQFGKMQVGERYLLVEEVDLSKTNRQLRILFNDNGAEFGAVNLSEPSVSIDFRDRNNALIFSNKGGQGSIQELLIESTSLTPLLNLNDSIMEVIRLTENNYLIATDKAVLEFNYALRTIAQKTIIGNAVLAFDEVNKEVIIGKDKSIWTYSYPAFQLLQSASSPEGLKQLIVRYNY